MKRGTIIGIVVLLLAGAAGAWFMLTQPSLADEGLAREVVTIERGDVVSSVKATGRLESRLEVALGFELNGTVAEVLVERGQPVGAGEPLARLEAADLELAVGQARVELGRAETQLAQVKAVPDADDVASARAALASAQASYQALLDGPTDEEITVAAANLRTAEVELQKAQWAYDEIAYAADVGVSPQAAELQRATIAYESALANYQLTVQDPTDEQLRAAEAQIAQAQATLNNLLEGASAEDIALAEANVEAARLALARAGHDLSRATLVAPLDGTVTEVNVAVGERPGSAAVILLADLSALHIDLPVDEIDLPAVEVGQPATITLDALPDSPLAGQVVAIAPAPIPTGGSVTSYEVTVTLGDQSEEATMGMTANVAIETDRREDVVVIPSHLIQVDQRTGRTYVEKLAADGQAVRTEVDLGLRSGQVIEVLNGLEAGDRVLVPPPELEGAAASGGGSLFSGMREAHQAMPDSP